MVILLINIYFYDTTWQVVYSVEIISLNHKQISKVLHMADRWQVQDMI